MQTVTIRIPIESENAACALENMVKLVREDSLKLKARRGALISKIDTLDEKIAVLETQLAEAKEELDKTALEADGVLTKLLGNEWLLKQCGYND